MNVHTIFLTGRSVKDAEILQTKAKKEFAKFSVAVNEYNATKKEEKTYYYEVLVFDKTAKKVVEHVKKGDIVVVMGKPEVEAYISTKEGGAKGSIYVIAESWKVLK